ncbi:hypothetical protein ACFY4C_23805 [Actinomadura viridis]|uniref:hypothetical protein n=1 Tax=Actinomadura viridis TaxID=58110 RepID=UPI003690099D
MIFLGLLLAGAAVAFATAVVLENSGAAQLNAFGETVPGVTQEWQVFAAGAVVAIVFMTGIALATFGFRRTMGLRRELRDLRYEHEESMQTLEMEKRHLQRELAQARRNAPGALQSQTSG